MIIIAQILFLFILIAFSALFSGSETAFFSISPIHRERMKVCADRESFQTIKLLETPSRLLAGILSGNMIVNIAATTLVTSITASVFPGKGAEYAIPSMVILLLLFGEITPKIIAARWNTIFAKNVAPVLKIALVILFPIVFVLERISEFSGSKKLLDEELTEADLKTILTLMRRSGDWQSEVVRALLGTLELDRIPISHFAIPREKWLVASDDAPVREIRGKFANTYGSAMVLFDYDEISGILESDDLLGAHDNSKAGDYAMPPVSVSAESSSSSLLATLMGSGIRWAVIMDCSQQPVGIIGLKTILSALVAEETLGELE